MLCHKQVGLDQHACPRAQRGIFCKAGRVHHLPHCCAQGGCCVGIVAQKGYGQYILRGGLRVLRLVSRGIRACFHARIMPPGRSIVKTAPFSNGPS